MRTISIAQLKAHLSAELKKVQAGDPVTVLDHKRPVAVLGPVPDERSGLSYVRRAIRKPEFRDFRIEYKGTWEELKQRVDEDRADRF